MKDNSVYIYSISRFIMKKRKKSHSSSQTITSFTHQYSGSYSHPLCCATCDFREMGPCDNRWRRKKLFDSLTNPSLPFDWSIKIVISNILCFKDSLHSCSSSWVKRDCNSAAHVVAKIVSCFSRIFLL